MPTLIWSGCGTTFKPMGTVWADPDRLSQVVTNLISNAIKFSPPDGEVVVAVERPRRCRANFGPR